MHSKRFKKGLALVLSVATIITSVMPTTVIAAEKKADDTLSGNAVFAIETVIVGSGEVTIDADETLSANETFEVVAKPATDFELKSVDVKYEGKGGMTPLEAADGVYTVPTVSANVIGKAVGALTVTVTFEATKTAEDKFAEEMAKVNADRAAAMADKKNKNETKIDVYQAIGDTVPVTEVYVKGKLKKRLIKTVSGQVTVNPGTKYTLDGYTGGKTVSGQYVAKPAKGKKAEKLGDIVKVAKNGNIKVAAVKDVKDIKSDAVVAGLTIKVATVTPMLKKVDVVSKNATVSANLKSDIKSAAWSVKGALTAEQVVSANATISANKAIVSANEAAAKDKSNKPAQKAAKAAIKAANKEIKAAEKMLKKNAATYCIDYKTNTVTVSNGDVTKGNVKVTAVVNGKKFTSTFKIKVK